MSAALMSLLDALALLAGGGSLLGLAVLSHRQWQDERARDWERVLNLPAKPRLRRRSLSSHRNLR